MAALAPPTTEAPKWRGTRFGSPSKTPKPKLCGCPEGLEDPRACRAWGRQNARAMDGVEWGLALVTAVTAALVYTVIPSWQAALGVVVVSGAVNVAAPNSTLSVIVGPAHLAASVFLIAMGLRSGTGMSDVASRFTAIAVLILLAALVNYLQPMDDDDDDEGAVIEK